VFQSYVLVGEQGDYWRLLEPLVYEGNTDRWAVPAGFVTDFASVPALVTPLLPRTGRHNRAAVLHDYLYRIAVGKIPSCRLHLSVEQCDRDLPPWLSRYDADRIFLRAMKELGVAQWRARAMYVGVRAAHRLGL
jgi:hypothetical protein